MPDWVPPLIFFLGCIAIWPLSGSMCDRAEQLGKEHEDEYQSLLAKKDRTKQEEQRLDELAYKDIL